MPQQTHYTFGDTDLAAHRLRLLAEAFEPSTAALLSSVPLDAGGAVDIGCGPGYSTELVAARLAPEWVFGIDRSGRLIESARRRAAPGLRFVEHDATTLPFPSPPAAVAYVRFLLTHLQDPEAALRAWLEIVTPGGRLVVEETASLSCEHPALSRYYALVERLQAHYGQRLYIGRDLDAICRRAGWAIEHSSIAALELRAGKMARLHALNLHTWGEDPFAKAHFVAQELEELGRELDSIASGEKRAPPAHCGMKQLVLRRSR